MRRNAVWSSELAVGDNGFVEKVKANPGRLVYPVKCTKCPAEQDFTGVSKMSVNEDPAQYWQSLDIFESALDWQIFDDNEI